MFRGSYLGMYGMKSPNFVPGLQIQRIVKSPGACGSLIIIVWPSGPAGSGSFVWIWVVKAVFEEKCGKKTYS